MELKEMIQGLREEAHQVQLSRDRLDFKQHYANLSAAADAFDRLAALERELAEARLDGARLRWYFDRANADKVVKLELRCINSGSSWTYEEWIAAIDAAMGGE